MSKPHDMPLPEGRTTRFTYAVGIVGMGYVGLPTALSLASVGCRVVGLDIDVGRLKAIRDGHVDLVPDDRKRLESLRDSELLTATSDPADLSEAEVVLVCVPTPIDRHLNPDLRILRGACASAVAHAVAGQTIVLTSTSYVGTTRELLVEPLEERGFHVGHDIFVASSPERIDPGNIAYPQSVVPRVVGGATAECTERAARIIGRYAPVHRVSSPEIAELSKLYENSFRAVNIALANEVADVSSALGLDANEVMDAAATKPYGFTPFSPGPGVGGHCIPCDPHYLIWQLRRYRLHAPIIEGAMDAIALRPHRVVERAVELLAEAGVKLLGGRVLIVGVAYKPGVEDVRESPAVDIIAALKAKGAVVRYSDPMVPSLRLLDGSTLASEAGAPGPVVDLVLVHTIHPGFDYTWVAAYPLVLDASFRLQSVPHRHLV